MAVTIDSNKARQAAELLYRCFAKGGILGHSGMPEDMMPQGVVQGSYEHIMFITLTVSIDYQRDAISLWESSRKTFEDSETGYLFDPQALHVTPVDKIMSDMRKYGLSKKHKNDMWIWRTVGVTLHKKWGGNPLNLLKHCDYDAPTIIKALKESYHMNNNKKEWDFPFLRGNKIGPLWLKMLRDNVGIKEFKNLKMIPIPVDIHIARSSLALGVVKGSFEGNLESLFENIREAWFEGVDGLNAKNGPMIAFDVDEPLWHLSKYGCSSRDKEGGSCLVSHICEARDLCVAGKVSIESGKVELDTL